MLTDVTFVPDGDWVLLANSLVFKMVQELLVILFYVISLTFRCRWHTKFLLEPVEIVLAACHESFDCILADIIFLDLGIVV